MFTCWKQGDVSCNQISNYNLTKLARLKSYDNITSISVKLLALFKFWLTYLRTLFQSSRKQSIDLICRDQVTINDNVYGEYCYTLN